MANHAQFASDEIEKLLAAGGVRDLGDAYRVGELLGEQHLRRATRHKNKHVVKFELNGPTGCTPVYIKRQWRRERLFPRPTDIRHRINILCSPIHEWRGLRILQDAGLNVSEPLAVFWSGWGLVQGAVVTRAVPPAMSMADMLLRGELLAMNAERRLSLIEAAVDVVVRLKHAGISWRSMKAKHFYPEESADGGWQIWLIDCEGVYRWASRRDCERDWKKFLNGFIAHSPALEAPFVAAYEGRPLAAEHSLKLSA